MGGPTTDSDALAWQTAVVGAGGTVSAAYLAALSTLVTTLKSNSMWVWDWFQPLATENATQGSRPAGSSSSLALYSADRSRKQVI